MPFTMTACDYQVIGASMHNVSSYMKLNFGDHQLIQRTSDAVTTSNLKHKRFDQLDITEHSYGSEAELQVPSTGDIYQYRVIVGGSCTWSSKEGEQLHLRCGDSMVMEPMAEFSMRYSSDCRTLIINIPRNFLQTTAREFGYLASDAPIHFKHEVIPFSRYSNVHNLLSDILDRSASTSLDRVSLYYAKLLSNALLTTYTNDLGQSQFLNPSSNRQIEQIRNYIMDNIATHLPVDDLAKICRISRKSLYNLFEREVGMTPHDYAQRLKLEAIYSEFNNNNKIRNVTEVALKYGFTNLGRFSSYYKEHIGELPSETLRRVSHNSIKTDSRIFSETEAINEAINKGPDQK